MMPRFKCCGKSASGPGKNGVPASRQLYRKNESFSVSAILPSI